MIFFYGDGKVFYVYLFCGKGVMYIGKVCVEIFFRCINISNVFRY